MPVTGSASANARRGTAVLPLPSQPIARPAGPEATVTTHIAVAARSLGIIEYDGFSLPLVSPDGLRIAVQQGIAPPWPILLGEPGGQVPPLTELAVYTIQTPPSAPSASSSAPLRETPPAPPAPHLQNDPAFASLPLGLLLGRAADHDGFLVEAPQPDGARWIGRVDWQSASLHWLVADDVINAHATLTPAGDLLYTRREIQPDGMGSGGSGGAGGVLVWLTAAGDEFRLPFPGSSAAYPIASADPTLAAVLLTHPGGIDIVGVQLQTDGATGHASGLRTGQRRRLGPPAAGAGASWPDIPDGYASPEGPNLALAFQHAAPVQQPPLPEGGSKGEGGSDGSRGEGSRHVQGPRDLLSRSRGIPFFFHAQGRMAMFDPLTATVTPLPPGTVAAVPLTVGPEGGNREALTTTTTPSTERGVLVAGPRGVLAVPASSGRVETFQPEHGIQVVPGAYLPRQTGVTGRYILFGPAEGAQESGSGRAGRGTAAAAGVSRGASWAGNQPGFEVLVVEVFAPSAE